jgi:hypothetical protein
MCLSCSSLCVKWMLLCRELNSCVMELILVCWLSYMIRKSSTYRRYLISCSFLVIRDSLVFSVCCRNISEKMLDMGAPIASPSFCMTILSLWVK